MNHNNLEPLPKIDLTAQILLLCSREALDDAQVEALRDLCSRKRDWSDFLAESRFRMVLPLVYQHFQRVQPEGVPGELIDALKAATRQVAMANLAMMAAHKRLVNDVLQPLDVPHLFFKGLSFAFRYYQAPMLRMCRDIDLLIPREHMLRVGQRLRETGFRAYPDDAWATDCGLQFRQRFLNMMDWVAPEGMLVEMPCSLDAGWDRLPASEMMSSASAVALDGMTLPIMRDEHFFPYMCKHHTRHHWARLHWIADLHAVTRHPRFDRAAVERQAARRGFERTVETAFAIDKAAAQPEPWRARFDDPFTHEVFRHCLVNLNGDRETEMTLREAFDTTSSDIPQPRRRLKTSFSRFAGRFRPAGDDFQDWPLPARWHSAYYALRPFLWARRKLNAMRQTRTGTGKANT